jgi:TetR/AcrR family transcriptional repressor of nem operon
LTIWYKPAYSLFAMPWKKSFDREAVLDRAKEAFWAVGYEGLSLDKLLHEMGIQKGSFYATYGGKHEVFLEALNRYTAERFMEFGRTLRLNTPLKVMEIHLDTVLAESTGANAHRGCFLVNASLELAPSDSEVRKVVGKALTEHERFYRRVFDAAKERGDLPEDFDSEGKAHALLGIVLGMRVMARAGLAGNRLRILRKAASDIFAA